MGGGRSGTAATLRVATWNLHGCVGHDRSFAPERSLAVVRTLDADILALQEVDSRHPRSAGLDTFAFFRARSGRDAFEARVFGGDEEGHYGHMLLSRYPILGGRTHDVSTPRREPRMVIDAVLDTPFGRVRVIAAHLGLGVLERRHQIRALARIVASEPPGPLILLGDFNEVRRRGLAQRSLGAGLQAAGAEATFPAHRPLLPLDRIWCRAPLVMGRSWVHRAARDVSDHLPLLAELACRPAAAPAGG